MFPGFDVPEACECGDAECRECEYRAEIEREARAEYGRSLAWHRWNDVRQEADRDRP